MPAKAGIRAPKLPLAQLNTQYRRTDYKLGLCSSTPTSMASTRSG